MTPEIKTILYATDLSENARHAFSYAADLADKYSAAITILYVMEPFNQTMEVQVSEMVGPEKWRELKEEKKAYLSRQIENRLQEFCREMEAAYDSCRLLAEDIRIEKGSPHEVILEVSDSIEADLIVMGTHGYNILKDAFIGGTARKVVRASRIPVLTVRLPGGR
ncbi:MAG: universal stress protein [Desulfobacterales bacterium]|nr:universal stress protein [Desulfobacterales bacterium]